MLEGQQEIKRCNATWFHKTGPSHTAEASPTNWVPEKEMNFKIEKFMFSRST